MRLRCWHKKLFKWVDVEEAFPTDQIYNVKADVMLDGVYEDDTYIVRKAKYETPKD